MDNFIYEDCYNLKGKEIHVDIFETSTPAMKCFHAHSNYEISFIISGNVTVLLSDQISTGTTPRVVVLRPYTQHFMIPEPDVLYKRINVSFTEKFVETMPDEWSSLYRVFAANGEIRLPDQAQLHQLEEMLVILKNESNPLRCRLLLMYYLSLLNEMNSTQESERIETPEYILKALLYINEHFHEKITAEDMAAYLNVGRTTLMMGFRRCTGVTFHRYMQNVRIRNVSIMHNRGVSIAEAAEACGFCDAGAYIRAYRSIYGTTPKGKK